MWGRVRSLAMLYMKDHPQVDIVVSANSPVDDGMEALIEGEADVAMASRKITVHESEAAKLKGLQLDEHLVGYGGIVIVTCKQNPVNELSIDQVRKILTGEIVNWKDINGKDQAIIVFKSGEKSSRHAIVCGERHPRRSSHCPKRNYTAGLPGDN